MSYKRLTGKGTDGVVVMDGCKTCADCTLNCAYAESALNRLAEFEDKIENGTLIDINEKFIVQEEINNKIRYLICEHSPTKLVVDFANDKAEAEKKLEELQKDDL